MNSLEMGPCAVCKRTVGGLSCNQCGARLCVGCGPTVYGKCACSIECGQAIAVKFSLRNCADCKRLPKGRFCSECSAKLYEQNHVEKEGKGITTVCPTCQGSGRVE